MKRQVKEFIEIRDLHSLDELIALLSDVRDTLPQGTETKLKLRGDDVFGRHLSISYLRDQSREEQELEDRYSAHADHLLRKAA